MFLLDHESFVIVSVNDSLQYRNQSLKLLLEDSMEKSSLKQCSHSFEFFDDVTAYFQCGVEDLATEFRVRVVAEGKGSEPTGLEECSNLMHGVSDHPSNVLVEVRIPLVVRAVILEASCWHSDGAVMRRTLIRSDYGIPSTLGARIEVGPRGKRFIVEQ